MFEHIATPIAYIVCLFFSFYMIAAILLFKMDANSQTYCDDAIHEFVDDARASGYISPTAYQLLMEKLNNTGHIYTVTIEHRSAIVYPTENSDTADSYTPYYSDEILAYMFPDSGDNRNYEMKNGDYLRVSYSEQGNTSGMSILLSFLPHQTGDSISGSYGGYVGSAGSM